MDSIGRYRSHPKTLKGLTLPDSILPTNDLEEALQVPLVLVAVPTQALRGLLTSLKSFPRIPALIVCSKGIEAETHRFPLEIAKEVVPGAKAAVLSGPNFALDVAQGLPSATTIASEDVFFPWLEPLAQGSFRPYLSDDPVGVQLCGALKNVLAIACGAIAGGGLGESAKAAALSRGAMEIARLGERLGAKTETILGLAGIGDITLTCTSPKSRNFSLGYALAQGQSLAEATEGGRRTLEGMHTVRSVRFLAERHNLELPICQSAWLLLYRNVSVTDLLGRLMIRPLKQENIQAKPVESLRKEATCLETPSSLQPT